MSGDPDHRTRVRDGAPDERLALEAAQRLRRIQVILLY
jgi:hypothetical protein